MRSGKAMLLTSGKFVWQIGVSAVGEELMRPRTRIAPHKRASGYTLLEICFALFIVAMMAGAALPSLSGWLAEEQLRGPARELAALARTARLSAVSEQQPRVITLQKDSFFLEPRPNTEEVPEPYRLTEKMTFWVRHWNETKWKQVQDQRWVFQPSGLCEPLHLKFQKEAAEIEMEFDPLTAAVADERYVFP